MKISHKSMDVLPQSTRSSQSETTLGTMTCKCSYISAEHTYKIRGRSVTVLREWHGARVPTKERGTVERRKTTEHDIQIECNRFIKLSVKVI